MRVPFNAMQPLNTHYFLIIVTAASISFVVYTFSSVSSDIKSAAMKTSQFYFGKNLNSCGATLRVGNKPNILLILADDLGYGDLSVDPFTGYGIKTPELEKMAKKGVIMHNFHVAAAVCTPSRASILTGLFPWRLGIYSIYDIGPQAKEYLALVPTVASLFHEAGYHTAHVGKWHLGGLRPEDVANRLQPSESRNCHSYKPGPHQHGFAEYISMYEGDDTLRMTYLNAQRKMYHEGSQYLIRNEVDYNKTYDILTDRQTSEAIRIMRETVCSGKNFFLNLWFDAPHYPWVKISPYDAWYDAEKLGGVDSHGLNYSTMVSNIDANIGHLRRAVKELGVAESTLIVFLSDNGPENNVGSAGPYKGRKRSLQEGGIRVPCIWEWQGVFPADLRLDSFGLSTDLFPTFLEAAGIVKSRETLLDGVSLLQLLKGRDKESTGDDRLVTWYKNIDGSSTAAWSNGFKIVSDRAGEVDAMYDMRVDATESIDLMVAVREAEQDEQLKKLASRNRSRSSRPSHSSDFTSRWSLRESSVVSSGSSPRQMNPSNGRDDSEVATLNRRLSMARTDRVIGSMLYTTGAAVSSSSPPPSPPPPPPPPTLSSSSSSSLSLSSSTEGFNAENSHPIQRRHLKKVSVNSTTIRERYSRQNRSSNSSSRSRSRNATTESRSPFSRNNNSRSSYFSRYSDRNDTDFRFTYSRYNRSKPSSSLTSGSNFTTFWHSSTRYNRSRLYNNRSTSSSRSVYAGHNVTLILDGNQTDRPSSRLSSYLKSRKRNRGEYLLDVIVAPSVKHHWQRINATIITQVGQYLAIKTYSFVKNGSKAFKSRRESLVHNSISCREPRLPKPETLPWHVTTSKPAF